MREKEHKTFKTDSLVLATFLLAKNCSLLFIDKTTNPHRASFEFEESKEREVLTGKFWRWEAQVEPRDFFAKQKELKNMLFSKSYLPSR